MPPLTKKDILLLLELLSEETVIPPSDKFPFRVSRKAFGYSDDETRGPLQAKLSIMLEVASRREKDS